MRDVPIDPKCFANLMGRWCVYLPQFLPMMQAAKAGTLEVNAAGRAQVASDPRDLYRIFEGVAVLPLAGPMVKGYTKYPHANTIEIRRGVRAAAADSRVRALVLDIDSPGGTVAGTESLARDVARAGESMPVLAHISDLGASAAYWVASQAMTISANGTAEVGSIGVVAVVEDTSEAYEAAGVTVHVLATGAYKGAFVDGAPITVEHLDYAQERVDDTFRHFREAVQYGRGMGNDAFAQVSDGRVFGSGEAMGLGLIDSVRSLEETVDAAARYVEQSDGELRKRRARAAIARGLTRRT